MFRNPFDSDLFTISEQCAQLDRSDPSGTPRCWKSSEQSAEKKLISAASRSGLVIGTTVMAHPLSRLMEAAIERLINGVSI